MKQMFRAEIQEIEYVKETNKYGEIVSVPKVKWREGAWNPEEMEYLFQVDSQTMEVGLKSGNKIRIRETIKTFFGDAD